MVLDRYILRLWVVPFITSLSLAIGVLLLGRALKVLGLISSSDVGWSIITLMLASILPYFIVLTVPIAAFFAAQTVIVHLQQDSELDALRSAGLSYFRIFRSLFAVSAVLWIGLSYNAMEWMPEGQKAFHSFLYAIKSSKAAPSFDPQRFNQSVDDFTIYIEGEDDQGRYTGFMLEDSRYEPTVLYLAELAEIKRSGNYLQFKLYRGARLEGAGSSQRAISFEEYQVSYNAGPMGLLKGPAGNDNITLMGMADLTRYLMDSSNLSPTAIAEWHRRILLPSLILVLILFTLPLSIEPKRSGKAGAYLLGVALLLIVYNTHIALYQRVASGGMPWWGMWIGEGLLIALGLELSRRVSLDRLPSLLGFLGELFFQIRQKILRKKA